MKDKSMTINIIIPDNLWDTDSEAVITTWLIEDGAIVTKGALLVEIMTEKIQHEIESPTGGTIRIIKHADDIVDKGDVIGTLS